jgi:predicted Zn-dependent peptidase
VLEGKPSKGISLKEAEEAIWEQLTILKDQLVDHEELQKVKNKIESTMLFSELSILDKAMNLAFYEAISTADDYNLEAEKYLAITPEQIKEVANLIFRKENSSTLFYQSKGGTDVE